MADTIGSGSQGVREKRNSKGQTGLCNRKAEGSKTNWSIEPAVGRCFDGLPPKLDGNKYLTSFSHNCILNYVKLNYGDLNGKAKKKRTSEVLSALRNTFESKNDEWTFGRLWSVSAKEILLPFMRELEKKSKMQNNLSYEVQEVFEKEMRELRLEFFLTCTSYRPKLQEQLSREYTDSMSALSQFLAYYCKKNWEKNCREHAKSYYGWESGIERLTNKRPCRADRLKGLGNSIVPQIAELLFRQINPLTDIDI